MKRLKFLLPLIIVLAGGAYFLFFYQPDPGKDTTENSSEVGDTLSETPEEPEIDPVERVRLEEIANFEKYLEVDNQSKKKLLGKMPVRGTLTNNAGIAIFKDIQLEISFVNDLGTELGKEYLLIQDYLDPGQSVEFEEKFQAPKGTSTAEITITDAKAVSEVPSESLNDESE